MALARRLPLLGLLLVLSVAGMCRWWAPGLYHFQDDQAQFLTIAREWLDGGPLPLHSVTFSVGVLTPPLVEYLLALPLLVTRNPELAIAFQAALDVGAVAIAYWCGRVFWGPLAGLAAGLLYAVNPSALLQVRKIQSHDFSPLFAAITLWGLYRLAVSRRPGHLLTVLLGYSLLLQTHLAYLFYAPLVGAVLLVSWRSWRWRPLLFGLALALLPWLPYLYFEVSHGFVNLQRATQFAGRPSSWDLDAPRLMVELIAGSGYLEELDLGRSLTGAETPVDAAGLVALALFAAGAAVLAKSLVPRPRSLVPRPVLTRDQRPETRDFVQRPETRDFAVAAITLGWCLTPVLFTLRHSVLLLSHYYVAALPTIFLVMASPLRGVQSSKFKVQGCPPLFHGFSALRPTPYALAAVAAAAVVAWQAAEFPLFLRAAAERGPWTKYGMGAGYSLQAARLAERVANDGPIYVAAHHPFELVFNYLFWTRRPVKRFDIAHDLVLPPAGGSPVAYVVQEARSDALAFLENNLAGQRRGKVLTPEGRPVYSVYLLRAEDADHAQEVLKTEPVEALIGGVAALRGAHLERRVSPPGPARAVLYWEVTGDPGRLPPEVTQFGHLLDSRLRGWGGEDFQGFPRYAWARGDRVFTWFSPEIAPGAPAGLYWLATGMYNRYDLQRFKATDPQGREVGEAVRLGPMAIAPPPLSSGPPPRPLAVFGGIAALLEASASPSPPSRGGNLQVALEWQALSASGRDYTVFVHLLDGDGRLVAQSDSQPAGGQFPTQIWAPGDRVRDVHELAVPPSAATGPYRLAVGLYSLGDLKRLPASGPDGEPLGDQFVLLLG